MDKKYQDRIKYLITLILLIAFIIYSIIITSLYIVRFNNSRDVINNISVEEKFNHIKKKLYNNNLLQNVTNYDNWYYIIKNMLNDNQIKVDLKTLKYDINNIINDKYNDITTQSLINILYNNLYKICNNIIKPNNIIVDEYRKNVKIITWKYVNTQIYNEIHLNYNIIDKICEIAINAWVHSTKKFIIFKKSKRHEVSDMDISIVYGKFTYDDKKSLKKYDEIFDDKSVMGHSHGQNLMDIHLNYDGIYNMNLNSILLLLIHEIGHSLGLPHNSNKKSIMYPFYTERKVDFNKPHKILYTDDIINIKNLYSYREPSNTNHIIHVDNLWDYNKDTKKYIFLGKLDDWGWNYYSQTWYVKNQNYIKYDRPIIPNFNPKYILINDADEVEDFNDMNKFNDMFTIFYNNYSIPVNN
ncbi:matrix metalloproteinase [Mythimna separata entomopoxvirus 'L']|uniref:Matrix metalloproteinase n=1 Tax=Mythimna separata entomopoxvirus 'L' TaxID=1293572 RepID=A0A916KQA4_9POXV|nr:matrix metalloproteinase [Mythimna separata entomopoxvirus 'L']CCU56386.1 matrix metalloproteinase [Mythimna separata entomopoxvirus 'L']